MFEFDRRIELFQFFVSISPVLVYIYIYIYVSNNNA